MIGTKCKCIRGSSQDWKPLWNLCFNSHLNNKKIMYLENTQCPLSTWKSTHLCLLYVMGSMLRMYFYNPCLWNRRVSSKLSPESIWRAILPTSGWMSANSPLRTAHSIDFDDFDFLSAEVKCRWISPFLLNYIPPFQIKAFFFLGYLKWLTVKCGTTDYYCVLSSAMQILQNVYMCFGWGRELRNLFCVLRNCL